MLGDGGGGSDPATRSEVLVRIVGQPRSFTMTPKS